MTGFLYFCLYFVKFKLKSVISCVVDHKIKLTSIYSVFNPIKIKDVNIQ